MKKQALLLIDHGSKRKEANDMIFDVVKLLQNLRPELIIVGAHMELASPTIAEGIKTCVNQGATHITAQPFMLSPGRHSTSDIPNLVQEAAKKYPTLTVKTSNHLGIDTKLAELILERAGL